MSNRLAAESSPYLLQHADNPVDWYPWGEEALERARREDRPILLSIGYAACHWCHVMAHESFEDPATAAVMNEHFVNIKVDREERPDLDSIYMQAVQAMTGHGGWPMTVFLTPEGVPFYGGTYYPPTDRQGMPAFTKVLQAIATSYRDKRDSVLKSAETVSQIYATAEVPGTAALEHGGGATDEPTAATLEIAYRAIAQQYDVKNGGFGGAPKFPPTMVMDFLLRHSTRAGNDYALTMARETFLKMARGGIYDQIGGGFARYAVDAIWLVPHFEKMLYDNALLIRFGTHLYQATGDEEVRRVTEETVEWLAREMTSPEGGFYSSLDADSEGHEGKFYVWTESELNELLRSDSRIVRTYYGVTSGGNFEGENILFVVTDPEVAAARTRVGVETLLATLRRAKRTLYEARAKRVWPGRDEKILAGWNGLALRGVAEAARTFGDPATRDLAVRNAEFLARELVRDGRVWRSHKDGVTRVPGFLEDYAAVALGFIATFELTTDVRWLNDARIIADAMIEWFWDDEAGAFFDTARDAERLITRPRDITDNAIPSGTSVATDLLLRLSSYLGDEAYDERARKILSSLAPAISRYPAAFGHLLGCAEYGITFSCHGNYCDMPSPAALDAARTLSSTVDHA